MRWTKEYDFLGVGNGAVSLQEEEHEKEQHLVLPLTGKDLRKNVLYLASTWDGILTLKYALAFPEAEAKRIQTCRRSLDHAAPMR
jgi:hypothetical protein